MEEPFLYFSCFLKKRGIFLGQDEKGGKMTTGQLLKELLCTDLAFC